jgi:hypothetical protein
MKHKLNQTTEAGRAGSPLPAANTTTQGGAHGVTRPTLKCWLIALALLSTFNSQLSTAFAQTYSIDWSTIDGGGGTSTGGAYSISGTIGQPDAGTMSGGQYSLPGGFWSLYAVQTPGAPLLSITLTPTNTAMVYWPSPSTGWTLQENTNSVSSANWTDHPFPQDNGAIRYIIVTPPAGNRFYRLKQ